MFNVLYLSLIGFTAILAAARPATVNGLAAPVEDKLQTPGDTAWLRSILETAPVDTAWLRALPNDPLDTEWLRDLPDKTPVDTAWLREI